ncbi:MAG: hypothetical protein PVG27_11585 [Chloroflexota bacterium]|jgi:hypothetical protein
MSRGWLGLIVAATLIVPLAFLLALRRWYLRWGATPQECRRTLPGDDVVSRPHLAFTRALTIGAPPSEVWPWLVQMGGYERAGWYSYDRFDNAGRPSASTIIPELQNLRVGDIMPTSPSGFGFTVEAIDPERSLVLTVRDPAGTLSIAFVLDPLGSSTRLLLRGRLHVSPTLRGLLMLLMMDAGDFVMMRKMLLGIRARAEMAHRRRQEGAATLG